MIYTIGGIGIYLVLTSLYLADRKFDCSFLNPINIYKEWCYTLNWFGIGIVIIFSNIFFLPYSIIYWMAKLIYFIVIVGRKEK